MKEQQMNLILASYKDTPVSFNDSGFLNATNIAKKFGKRVQHYLDSNRTKNYIKELKKFMCVKTASEQNQLVIVKKEGLQKIKALGSTPNLPLILPVFVPLNLPFGVINKLTKS